MSKVDIIKVIPNYINGVKQLKITVGYARVSTESEEQDTSYVLQIKELENDIKSNPNYQFMGIFKDKATGTSAKYRNEFKMMIELARKKEIDLIITKSISRFGRNLTETISIIRELRRIGVEVYFQKENISSLDDSFDFLFSILSSHAEEESHNISRNKLWSVKRQKQNGESLTHRLYGYKITGNEYHIIEDEAKVIRKIFDLYINGSTYKDIIGFLFNHNISSPTGNPYWAKTTLEGMLRNEKFCGDMMLGKDFSVNGLRKVNHGDLTEKVFVQNNHKGIISKETFARAQAIREKRRKKHTGGPGSKSPYVSFIYSTVNEKHLKYVMERPKGKSGRNKTEIPTLYCNGLKPGTNRVGFQVKVILDLLAQIVKELKPKILSITYPLFKELTTSISVLETTSSYHDDSFSPLTHKLKLINHLERLKEIQSLLTSTHEKDINDYRKIFNKIMIGADSISLKLSLSNEDTPNLENYSLIHESTLTYIKLFKPITLPIKVYLGGSF